MNTQNSIIEITDSSFTECVVQSQSPVLLAFCADDCAASQKLLAMLANAAPRCRSLVTFAKASPAKVPELAARLGIVSAPAVLLFRDGTVGYQFVGELSRWEFDDLLTRAAGSNSINHDNPTFEKSCS
jgi:thioredoxin 1